MKPAPPAMSTVFSALLAMIVSSCGWAGPGGSKMPRRKPSREQYFHVVRGQECNKGIVSGSRAGLTIPHN